MLYATIVLLFVSLLALLCATSTSSGLEVVCEMEFGTHVTCDFPSDPLFFWWGPNAESQASVFMNSPIFWEYDDFSFLRYRLSRDVIETRDQFFSLSPFAPTLVVGDPVIFVYDVTPLCQANNVMYAGVPSCNIPSGMETSSPIPKVAFNRDGNRLAVVGNATLGDANSIIGSGSEIIVPILERSPSCDSSVLPCTVLVDRTYWISEFSLPISPQTLSPDFVITYERPYPDRRRVVVFKLSLDLVPITSVSPTTAVIQTSPPSTSPHTTAPTSISMFSTTSVASTTVVSVPNGTLAPFEPTTFSSSSNLCPFASLIVILSTSLLAV